MTAITFTNIPFPIPERWVLDFQIKPLRGTADIDYDEDSHDGMCSYIEIQAMDGGLFGLFRHRLPAMSPLEREMFLALEKSILIAHTKLVDEIVDEHEPPDCSYGPSQSERL